MRFLNLSCKFIGITIVFMLFSYGSFCQINYSIGYIINLNNDTIKGYIDDRNWDRNPNLISFKTNLNEKESNYKPIDIKSFRVHDELYESAIIERGNRINQMGTWDNTPELKIETDTVYLQTMIKGNKSLSYLKDRNGIEQFYIKIDNSYNLLIHKQYLKVGDDKDMLVENKDILVENKKFIGQLMVYLQDCPGIQTKLKDIRYNKSDLEKLFLSYYKNTNTTKEFQKKTEKIKTEIGFLIGISNTTVQFITASNQSAYYYLGHLNFKPSNNISAGLSFEFILPRIQKKWSINNELIYTTSKYSGHYDDYYNPASIELGFTYLKMNNMLRYKYPIGNLYPYINFGISNGFMIQEINNKFNESTFHTNTIEKALDETKKYEQGYLVGFGSKYKKFSFEFRYEKGNGMSVTNLLNTTTKRLYCFLGYQF